MRATATGAAATVAAATGAAATGAAATGVADMRAAAMGAAVKGAEATGIAPMRAAATRVATMAAAVTGGAEATGVADMRAAATGAAILGAATLAKPSLPSQQGFTCSSCLSRNHFTAYPFFSVFVVVTNFYDLGITAVSSFNPIVYCMWKQNFCMMLLYAYMYVYIICKVLQSSECILTMYWYAPSLHRSM
jgi:hypothetical protein